MMTPMLAIKDENYNSKKCHYELKQEDHNKFQLTVTFNGDSITSTFPSAKEAIAEMGSQKTSCLLSDKLKK
jgi:hypothetical protein